MDFYFLLVFGFVCFSSVLIVFWLDVGSILQLFDALQIIPYLIYMQVNHTVLTKKFFSLFSKYYDFNFFEDIINERFLMRSLEGFKKEGVDSLFVRNSQRYLFLFASLLIFYLFVRLIQLIFNRYDASLPNCMKSGKQYLNKIVIAFNYQVLAVALQVAYINLAVFAILQLTNIASTRFI